MRQYIGARYVPKFLGTYDNTQAYEALCVVDNGLGTSYISKVPTPAGTPLTDTDYWAVYGTSSGAIINLQTQIGDLLSLTTTDKDSLTDAINEVDADIQTLSSDIQTLSNDFKKAFVTPQMFGAKGDGVHDDTTAINDALAATGAIILPKGTYKVTSTITLPDHAVVIGEGENTAIMGYHHGAVLYHDSEPVVIKNIHVTRPAGFSAVSGDDGVVIGNVNGWSGRGVLENILSSKHYNGFVIKAGSVGIYAGLYSIENENDGFYVVNGRGEFNTCIATNNKANGFELYQDHDGETGIDFVKCGTFTNQNYGWYAHINTGVTNAANLYLCQCNSSCDGNHGIAINGYHNVLIQGGLTEFAGCADDWVPGFTTNTTAKGMYILNSHTVTITGFLINHNKGDGLELSNCHDIIIGNCSISDNGGSLTASNRNGLNIQGSTNINVDNCIIKNLTGSYQEVDLSIGGSCSGIFSSIILETMYNYSQDTTRFNNVSKCNSYDVAVANTVVLPFGAYYVNLTGSGTIYGISNVGVYMGQIVTLKFNDSVSVSHSSTMRLSNNADITFASGDTLTVVFVGNAWCEIGHCKA